MEISKTKKKGVPMAAYLCTEGWHLELELRDGSQDSQDGFITFLERIIEKARSLTSRKILMRLYSAHDTLDTRVALAGQKNVSYIIKVMRAVERTVDRRGQRFLMPEIEIDGWWTMLDLPEKGVIGLYEDHVTSEQFHSKIKSDMDIERLPSGKFATNVLILTLAGPAYNILCAIAQLGLVSGETPVRHAAKRRRIKTVMLGLMYLAARLVKTGRRVKLVFSVVVPLLLLSGPSTRALLADDGAYRGLLHAEYLV
jgi:hypothetical protein